MSSRQGMIRTSIALAVAFALAAPLTASAQAGGGAGPAPAQGGGAGPAGAQGGGGRGRGAAPPPYTPAPGARDLRSVLHNWGWHMGMLRGEAEIDLIASLEYKGTGSQWSAERERDSQRDRCTDHSLSRRHH